jgi:hypothetical protein
MFSPLNGNVAVALPAMISNWRRRPEPRTFTITRLPLAGAIVMPLTAMGNCERYCVPRAILYGRRQGDVTMTRETFTAPVHSGSSLLSAMPVSSVAPSSSVTHAYRIAAFSSSIVVVSFGWARG